MSVHPRGCGEYAAQDRHAKHHAGSSPRMRGILAGAADGLEHQRFIPADAGNTHGVFPLHQLFSVHPRGCGEYYSTAILILISTGSSPRMRGIRRSWRGRRWPCRFIPADAGNTIRTERCSPAVAVHPRGCGEYFRETKLGPIKYGSSPRMRGIRYGAAGAGKTSRFIPADAGNTPGFAH